MANSIKIATVSVGPPPPHFEPVDIVLHITSKEQVEMLRDLTNASNRVPNVIYRDVISTSEAEWPHQPQLIKEKLIGMCEFLCTLHDTVISILNRPKR